MGAEVALDEHGLTVTRHRRRAGRRPRPARRRRAHPGRRRARALAESPSVLRGIAHIRGHETDRLAALATELNRLGGDVAERPDGLEIRPAPLHGGLFRTYADHRMAHAGVILGLAVPGRAGRGRRHHRQDLPRLPGRLVGALRGLSVAGRDRGRSALRPPRPGVVRPPPPAHPAAHQGPPDLRRRRRRARRHRRPGPLHLPAGRRGGPLVTAMKSRPAGPQGRRGRRPGPAGRRRVRRRRHAGAHRRGRRRAPPCCAAPPTTTTRSSG